MSLSTEFRRSIKPFIIINSIFTTGLIEYFNCYMINAIGMVYACFSIIFYVIMVNVISFPREDSYFKQSGLRKMTHQLHVYISNIFIIAIIIIGVLRRKVIFFVLQFYSIHQNIHPLTLFPIFRRK